MCMALSVSTTDDDNRIVLQTLAGHKDCQEPYVNACYLNVSTYVIVMVTNIHEGGKVKCEQYWPDSGAMRFGPFQIAITDQQMFADYTVRVLRQ